MKYMQIRPTPSFFEIFWWVFKKIKKAKTEITRKIRATANGWKLVICMGCINETTPNINVELKATFPIWLPNIIQSCPHLAAWMLKIVSGKQFPMDTTNKPISAKERFNSLLKNSADFTMPYPPAKSKAKPPIIYKKSSRNLVNDTFPSQSS